MNEQDRINQRSWAGRGPMQCLAALQGFTDAGEQAAYWEIADEMRNHAILDLGVGPGRTIPLLRALSAKYVAMDYLPSMVELAQRRYPFVDVRLGDARDLSQFSDGTFRLVVFSYSGLDAVDHDDRRCILNEVNRVLVPNGVFWFSTLNEAGGAPRERPWSPRWGPRNGSWLHRLAEVLQAIKQVPRSTLNYWRLRQLRRQGDGWSIAPFSSHANGLLVHYTSMAHQLAELKLAGFSDDPTIFDPRGVELSVSDDLSNVDFFNILARK